MRITIGEQLEALGDRPQHHRRTPSGAVALGRASVCVQTRLGLGGSAKQRSQGPRIELVRVQVEARE
jgi:hypothetical protein